ncbi:MAG TPA: TIGR03986 family CRISPR-associated RAMP protein, partial [Rhodospirillum rubrum]|nr:TIGR03986 family CRISPR-associated RAMP protein [Rhodospirillum rubrum]
MPGEFLNTYHFVPVRDGGPTLGPTHDLENVRVALANDRAGAKEWDIWSHDRWHDGHLSGRITCTLTTEDPLVIGAEQKRGENGETCTIVAPYLLDGKPAIPPTTLKGMLSALIEAATNSAMRVLDDRALSVRQDMNKALSAIGMVMRKPGVAQTESEGWDLIPLTLPTIKLKPGAGYPESPPPSFPIPHSFLTLMKTLRWKPAQKVFVGTLTWPKAPPGTNRQEPPTPDEDFKFMMRAGTYSSAAPATYLMDITPLPLTPDGKAITYKPLVTRVKQLQTPGKPEFLIGQKSRNSKLSRPILESDVPEEQRQTMTRGILRVMHHDDRVNDLPHTRKHEVFIPLPQDLECAPRLPIPSAVVRLFHALADERTQTQSGGRDQSEWGALPFHP